MEICDNVNRIINDNMMKYEVNENLKNFLKENFKLNKNFDEVISYLMKNPELIKHVYRIPSLYAKEFPGDDLIIQVITLFEDPILSVDVKTSYNGLETVNKIDLVDNSFHIDDVCLNNFVLDVRFK